LPSAVIVAQPVSEDKAGRSTEGTSWLAPQPARDPQLNPSKFLRCVESGVHFEILSQVEPGEFEMGIIKDEVKEHLATHPAEAEVLEPFLQGFEISWGRRRRAYNATLSVFILTCEKYIRETFGFTTQVALFIPHHAGMQPRVFQAIGQFLTEEPLAGRVDPTTFFIVCGSNADKKAVFDYVADQEKNWIIIALTVEEIRSTRTKGWGIRQPIAAQIFTRDLFNEVLPLRTDLDFFGREGYIFELGDAIQLVQNIGLFGLRKTGKTSVLYKLQRTKEGANNIFLYYDCKKPRYRELHYGDFLTVICEDISSRLGIARQFRELPAVERIERIAAHVGKRHRIVLIFDEIEYISFRAKLDPHWRDEFVSMWQTLWALQSEYRNFCYLISGVNPTVVEQDDVNGTQNPLFGIVKSRYLTGLSLDEVRRMVHVLGRRMGLSFQEDATLLLFKKYGGHPLLTRQACSVLHTNAQAEKLSRPVQITEAFLKARESLVDSNIEFYFSHILTELSEFYPTEYEMLSMTVSGQMADFVELARDSSLRRHLENYGLISIADKTFLPTFKIECLRPYLERETARVEKRPYKIRLVQEEARQQWLAVRTNQITREMRELDKEVKAQFGFRLYSRGGIFEPEEFVTMPSSQTMEGFERFINVCYRSLVEEIDRSGREQHRADFFFREVRDNLPDLQSALYRIRAYRHWRFHSERNPAVEAAIKQYFELDLGKEEADVHDLLALQQIVLDELFLAMQVEMARLED
jgi:hypothetical protein